MSNSEYLRLWSQLHGNAQPSGIVKGWLRVAGVLARPFIWLRFSPNLISLIGLALAVCAWWVAPHPIAAVFVILSLILDGIDGAVALMTDRVTLWGGVIDSVTDRVGEVFLAAALVVLGADFRLVLVAWTLSVIQEYARARVLSLVPEIELRASVCERPVRALIVAAAFAMSISPILTTELNPSVWAGAWAALQSIGVVQVWSANRRALQSR